MWVRFGRSSSKDSEALNSRFGALANLRGRFGRQEPKTTNLRRSRRAGSWCSGRACSDFAFTTSAAKV